ncbi:16S rRNA (guanine(966)-N(2))-methyltransferase RsmD [Notoacmeibacter sp. MSK16QG-6]|uniref:16S rRNA (guanine(966)-N(2))-methyltransferase RsmD n=1 Tax=Notoacmeibacter sp. MSK16QG-6 TaxID=2957982 RepID=UPI00209E28D5|nr:16S rRNA (guanine(966)-N(2))-methyltransferase RsmD [Notoacmeibacter sp. MSK16QG-6]MCP1198505.1 16S rRNA (guanine(966)-N(2))-methyltransferase RsmD [Notoacmeibacter sp. MSK16QG-6]
MRIVGGSYRGRSLKNPPSDATRPTTDRMRESLFNILAHRDDVDLNGARVLDLFAGTGALGLEAMSRGAEFALFVEDSGAARATIRSNVELLGLTGRTKIFRRDATRIGDVGTMKPFQIVFADPPYRKDFGEKALAAALSGGWLAPGAFCVLEEAADATFSLPSGFLLEDERRMGDSILRFLRPHS